MTPEQIEKERVKFEAHFGQPPHHSYGCQRAWVGWLARAEQDQALRAAVGEH